MGRRKKENEWEDLEYEQWLKEYTPKRFTCSECGGNFFIREKATQHKKGSGYGDLCKICSAKISWRLYMKSHAERARFKRKQAWADCLLYFNDSCAACGRKAGERVRIVADHWNPTILGGQTNAFNMIPLCHGPQGCNNSKGHLPPDVWLRKRFGPDRAGMIAWRINAYFQWLETKQS